MDIMPTYYVFDKELESKPVVIVWFENGYRFNLSGFLDAETLLEIAKSVKEK